MKRAATSLSARATRCGHSGHNRLSQHYHRFAGPWAILFQSSVMPRKQSACSPRPRLIFRPIASSAKSPPSGLSLLRCRVPWQQRSTLSSNAGAAGADGDSDDEGGSDFDFDDDDFDFDDDYEYDSGGLFKPKKSFRRSLPSSLLVQMQLKNASTLKSQAWTNCPAKAQ